MEKFINRVLGVFLFILMTHNAIAKMETTRTDTLTKEQVKSDRAFFNGLGKIYPPSKNVEVNPITIAGVDCHWLAPKNYLTDVFLVYLHGGSYGLGGIESHGAMVSRLAESFNIKVLLIDYALAPEQPYPAAKNDVLKVYRHLSKVSPEVKKIIMGDSAGGGLLLSALAELQLDKSALPDGIIMFSPWIDLSCSNPSYEINAKTDVLTRNDLKKYADAYVGKHGREAINPSQIKFKNFPVNLILVSGSEILLDDSKNFHRLIKKVQRNSQIAEFKKASHVWPLTDIASPNSKAAVREITTFIENIAGRSN
jgi:acetyl esterase/lipase